MVYVTKSRRCLFLSNAAVSVSLSPRPTSHTPHPHIPAIPSLLPMDEPIADLEKMFPDFAERWLTEADVISALLWDRDLRTDTVELLNIWLEEIHFDTLQVNHELLSYPIIYERGGGEEQLLRQLRAR